MIIYLQNTSQVTGYALKPLVFHHTGLVEGLYVAVNAYGHNTQLQLFSLSEVSFTASFTEKYLLNKNKIEDAPLPLLYTLYPLS